MGETLGFQAEVRQLLRLIIHSVYSEKEIFLRELVSNASDALDRLRFLALTRQELYGEDSELKIAVSVDAKAKTITISDNGIGMDREELISNLGTIARSGTAEFLQSLAPEQAKDARLIGEFGIGFYAAFLVAGRVVVETRKASADPVQAVRWESSGDGEYTISESEKKARGTDVILHLREDSQEYLNCARVRRVIRTYSDHIPFQITLHEIEKDEAEKINRGTALWLRPKQEVADEEHADFYKHISHDYEAPLAHVHSKIEGKLSFNLLLYVPSRAPFNMWSEDARHGVRLYVKRVFIAEGVKNLLPSYLRFVRGVIDSDDIPLNISRELVQQNRIIDELRAAAVKKVIGLLEDLNKNDPSKYARFWREFGEAIKEGMAEDFVNREALKRLLRFSSTYHDREEQDVSLIDYVARMQKGQERIYYLTAETFDAAKNSPLLELFRKKNVEVLLLHQRSDAWLMPHLGEFEGKQIESAAKDKLDLGSIESERDDPEEKDRDTNKEEVAEEFRLVLARMEKILGDRVHEATLSKRLQESPVCLVTRSGGELGDLLRRGRSSLRAGRLVLEINPEHELVSHLKNERNDQLFNAWTEVLYHRAVLNAGGDIDNPAEFSRQLDVLLMRVADGSSSENKLS